MNLMRFFLLLFTFPNLIYGFSQDMALTIHDQIKAEWTEHSGYVELFNKADPKDWEKGVLFLNAAVDSCRNAIFLSQEILSDIDKKPKIERWDPWWVALKEVCERDKEKFTRKVGELQQAIDNAYFNVSFKNAHEKYLKSEKLANIAKEKSVECTRTLTNIKEVVSSLNEAASLYREALSVAEDALDEVGRYPDDSEKIILKKAVETYQKEANRCRKEAHEWPSNVVAQKGILRERLATLRGEIELSEEKGFNETAYELQKQAIPILEQLILCKEEERPAFKAECEGLKCKIAEHESNLHLLNARKKLNKEEFIAQEQERRSQFFNNDFLLHPQLFFQSGLSHEHSTATPLDGQIARDDKKFTLYTKQFYRFLVQDDTPPHKLYVKVHEDGKAIHQEKISIPVKNTLSWERYVLGGMVYIPETKLKEKFGMDLRLGFTCDPIKQFSMIVAQRSMDSRYQISFSLDETDSLYECNFSEPLPWQLASLQKPFPSNSKHFVQTTCPAITPSLTENDKRLSGVEEAGFSALDQLIEQFGGNPLTLTQFVYNEIALVDPFLYQEKGVFYAPGIHRSAHTTYLEKQGSPWEQCQLLVYLLRKAGYQALYAEKEPYAIPKEFFERMLLTKLPEGQKEAIVQYPWVLFFDGRRWVSLFPWMKEMQVHEGYDLYSFLPDEYATADRWILNYLKNDEKILKHIGSDGDDTAGVLFARFVEEELKKQGLTTSDVGIQTTLVKKQFSSWDEFPSPEIDNPPNVLVTLDDYKELFATANIEISSRENPSKKLSQKLRLDEINYSTIPIHFSSLEDSNKRLHVKFIGKEESTLDLDAKDIVIDVKVTYDAPVIPHGFNAHQTLSLAKGSKAALCFHFGGATSKDAPYFYEKFSKEKEDEARLQSLLSYVGASYFEKCSRAELTLTRLHKINPTMIFAFGLSKLSPGVLELGENSMVPQMDVFWFHAGVPTDLNSLRHQELHSARMQCGSLITVDASSNEHQVLKEVFQDSQAVSTVKLLQIAHAKQQKQDLKGDGFLAFTPSILALTEKAPEAAQSLYFSQIVDLSLRDVKDASSPQWNLLKNLLNYDKPFGAWSYAYTTPGLTGSENAVPEMSSLILYPYTQYALISNNNLVANGGSSSLCLGKTIAASAVSEWKLIPGSKNNYKLEQSRPSVTPVFPGASRWISDVRKEHKFWVNNLEGSVDVVSGAFYIDEIDFSFPGSFPLEIRRNYSSKNLYPGEFGRGWKLSLNPWLIEQDGMLYAAESDGSVIAYSYNSLNSRWEVLLENNLELSNFMRKGLEGEFNPLHSYIQNDILYGADGSKRYFEKGLLKKWVNAKGNALTFSYDGNLLSRIYSSNGDYCGFHYNYEGKISEIYGKDGRRISYAYNLLGDLEEATLPNSAVISYTYDKAHRIVRETRPHGKVVENSYDAKGRIKEQRLPMGMQQEMVATVRFAYQDGITTVTDAAGRSTVYKIFQNQIYKVIDPLGHQMIQSWFIDSNSWFDPEIERVVKWSMPGGFPRSLKSSTDKRGLTTYYLYDSRGNVEEIGLKGDDLTGNGKSMVAKKLSYDANNLCTQEVILDQKIVTHYDAVFSYLPKRIEKYGRTSLLSYLDVEYNSSGQIEKEDRSGAITYWKYDAHGFPIQKTQITGTEDPDVITFYTYNTQGKCIQVISVDGIQENEYDIMGNPLQSRMLSPSHELQFATYSGYDLNNLPIWKQTANTENTLYMDYHLSGLLKASRQTLNPGGGIAYTLYEYDSQGRLVQEVDPRGYCTYRDYNALGQMICEMKEGHSTMFSYEPGGLVRTITSPAGGQTTRSYTTNGLLKEEVYPDGTKNSIVYDFFARPIFETKNGITWEIRYDDINNRSVHTHTDTKEAEYREFDLRGNLIRFTDAAGYTTEKTYDLLNRLKMEVTPSGQRTIWSYQGDTVVCTCPNGEKLTKRYEAGNLVESKVTDVQGTLVESSSYLFDSREERQEIVHGDDRTVIWMNTLGLPVRMEKGDVNIVREYDFSGNCTALIDGEGRRIHQQYDGLSRMILKELPDGNSIKYSYDADSNLTECKLFNLSWKASYDLMGRKLIEELISDKQPSRCLEYAYENGALKTFKDSMQRIHYYSYDSHGRLLEEDVDGWSRKYAYDPRGLLSSVEQFRDGVFSWLYNWIYGLNSEHSKVLRSYNADGRLSEESIYLNSKLIQQTAQSWTPSGRSILIDHHKRDFTYQNNRLVNVVALNADLTYSYDLAGLLKEKSSQFSSSKIKYNGSGLPEQIYTSLPDASYVESMKWDASARLVGYTSPREQRTFVYDAHGNIQREGDEKYPFDLSALAAGMPEWYVPNDGLDAFEAIISEVNTKILVESEKNGKKDLLPKVHGPMGQSFMHDKSKFGWDPWGKLLKVTDGIVVWEASYDALGRRLETRYTPHQYWNAIRTTTSFYDPENNVQEIGIKYQNKTFWKIHGIHSCDAIIDETGISAFLINTGLQNIAGIVSRQGTLYSDTFASTKNEVPLASDLFSYAKSLKWPGSHQDPTGFVWTGEKYYDPLDGKFLTPSSGDYQVCLNPYTNCNAMAKFLDRRFSPSNKSMAIPTGRVAFENVMEQFVTQRDRTLGHRTTPVKSFWAVPPKMKLVK